uniref:Zinc-finger domain-containing protein n=1 Tax=Desulfacinum infernum TaxID=35837 RepID=A0A832EI85_9BACT
MSGCKDFEEALILDVLGELDSKRLPQWAAHAAACPACRAERERLARMMHQVKAASTPEPLSPNEAAHMTARIRWALNNAGRAARLERKTPFWKGFGPKPAWAFGILVCLLLAVTGAPWKAPFKKTLDPDRPATVLTPATPEPTDRGKNEASPAPASSAADQKLAAATPSAAEFEDDLPEQDREVLENLDFLKELETIRKLVHVVDQDEDAPAPSEASDSAQQPTSMDPRDSSYA